MSRPPSRPPAEVLTAATRLWRRVPGGHSMPIEGHSMRPLLRPGDSVFVAHTAADLRPGAIIVFWHNNTPVVRRLIRVEHGPTGPVFITKGDNVAQCDAPVAADAIIGKVSRAQRGNRPLQLDNAVWRRAGKLWAGGQKLVRPPANVTRQSRGRAAVVRRLMLALSYAIFIPARTIDALNNLWPFTTPKKDEPGR